MYKKGKFNNTSFYIKKTKYPEEENLNENSSRAKSYKEEIIY